MFSYTIRRLLSSVPVMAVVALFVFFLLRLTPGDPAAIIAGDTATLQQIQEVRIALGLNQPLHLQFIQWVGQLLSGDLGVSLISKAPVLEMIAQRVEPTLSLALVTILLSSVLAVPIGVFAAWKRGSWLDSAVMAISVLGFSIPSFVVGYGLTLFFAIELNWVPVQGFRSVSDGLWPFLQYIILPACMLSAICIALIARTTRSSMIEVLGSEYVRTARAMGVAERFVLFGHALRNSAIPIVTVIGTTLGALLSGVVVAETVFNIPGLGRLTVDAVLARDYPLIQGIILLTSAAYVLVNLLIDLSYALFDPRIRY